MFWMLTAAALATEPVDIGVIKDTDIQVVQKLLYTKEGRLEYGGHVGVMPFDGLVISPQVAATGAYHLSESLSAEVQLGGGYGFKTGRYKTLESPAYGVAVESYRYLGSVEATAQWSPIYAKMNLAGKKVLHHDVYGLAGLGLTVEQSMLPSADLTFAPTLPVGVGARVFLTDTSAARIELRDHLLLEHRVQSDTRALKQDFAITVGYTMFGPAKEKK